MNRKMPRQPVMHSKKQYSVVKKKEPCNNETECQNHHVDQKRSHTRECMVWFLFYEILTETNIIYGKK